MWSDHECASRFAPVGDGKQVRTWFSAFAGKYTGMEPVPHQIAGKVVAQPIDRNVSVRQ